MTSELSWDLGYDVALMLSYHFMLNALRAGTIVAVVAGAIGYLMVLRGQSFAGYSEESAGVGTVQAFALACGFLFVSLYKGFLSGLNNLLFGTITGVTDDQVLTLLLAGVACLLVLLGLGRPLLFASVDPAVAAARGVPVRGLGVAFLLLLGAAAAGTSQVTGSLLVFALLVAPAAAASRLTARPSVGLLVAVALAVVITWAGETIAFFSPYPIGFWVTTLAFATFLLAAGRQALRNRAGRRLGRSRPVLAHVPGVGG